MIWVAFIAFAILILIFRKECKLLLRWLLFALGAVWLAFAIAMTAFPIENLFVTHATPQSALHYTFEGKIGATMDGADSTFVIHAYQDSNSHLFLWYWYEILPRTEKGWKITTRKNRIDSISRSYPNEFGKHEKYHLTIMKREKQQGFYVVVKHHPSSDYPSLTEEAVADSLGSRFLVFVDPDGINVGDIWWVVYMDSFDRDYEVYFDGEAVGFGFLFLNMNEELVPFDTPFVL